MRKKVATKKYQKLLVKKSLQRNLQNQLNQQSLQAKKMKQKT